MKTAHIKSFLKRIKTYAAAHKAVSAIIILATVIGGYSGIKKIFSTPTETRYVTAAVTKGMVISSITGSGQVSASNQVDLKAKGSGDVISVPVTNGQTVKAGQLIAQLDASDAQKSLRDAENNLETAKLSLQKLQQPADALSLTQSQNSLADARDSLSKAQEDLAKAYDDAFTSISTTFLDLPNIMSGMYDLLYKSSRASPVRNIDYYSGLVPTFDNTNVDTFKTSADTSYIRARASYDALAIGYKAASRTSSTSTIADLLAATLETMRLTDESTKNASNLFDYVNDKLTYYGRDIPPQLTSDRATASSYTSKITSHLSDLLGNQNSIKNDAVSIENSQRTITERTQSLAKLNSGTDALDLRSAQLSVEQRQNALLDAQLLFSNYSVRAPFAGTIASLNVKRGDSLNSGTAVATLVTEQKIASITLNEVDVAKIKLGDKTTLTFDAVDGLSISGEVAEIDTVGTVSQGVVNYNVKISFDTQDARIKPGMSVSASIITDSRQDVLVVPNSAIKSQGGQSYVEMFDTPLAESSSPQGAASAVAPSQVPVEVGLASDSESEITGGLKEGDQIVVRTITASAAKTPTASAPSLFGGAATRGATGANRTFTR
jgi:HlyD family secretion protein